METKEILVFTPTRHIRPHRIQPSRRDRPSWPSYSENGKNTNCRQRGLEGHEVVFKSAWVLDQIVQSVETTLSQRSQRCFQKFSVTTRRLDSVRSVRMGPIFKQKISISKVVWDISISFFPLWSLVWFQGCSKNWPHSVEKNPHFERGDVGISMCKGFYSMVLNRRSVSLEDVILPWCNSRTKLITVKSWPNYFGSNLGEIIEILI